MPKTDRLKSWGSVRSRSVVRERSLRSGRTEGTASLGGCGLIGWKFKEWSRRQVREAICLELRGLNAKGSVAMRCIMQRVVRYCVRR